MSFERINDTITFVCDACSDFVEIEDPDNEFGPTWAKAKEDGWRFKKGEHFCPKCAGLK